MPTLLPYLIMINKTEELLPNKILTNKVLCVLGIFATKVKNENKVFQITLIHK
jgi:hypothetical protein